MPRVASAKHLPAPAVREIPAVCRVRDWLELLHIDERTFRRWRSSGYVPAPDFYGGSKGTLPMWRGESAQRWIEAQVK
jgi:hypothetical protein